MVDNKSIKELYKLIEEDFNHEIVEKESYKEVANRRKFQSDVIENALSRDEYELLEEYLEIEHEVGTVEMEEAFVKGFSMAYQFIIDSLR